MNFFPIIVAAEETAAQGTGASAVMSLLITFVPVLLVFYFFLVRPQKRQEKEEKEMRDSLAIGDEVITIGGIIGLVVRMTDDTVVLETGGDRSKIRIQRSAVKVNVTDRERKQAASAEKNAKGPNISDKKEKKSEKQ